MVWAQALADAALARPGSNEEGEAIQMLKKAERLLESWEERKQGPVPAWGGDEIVLWQANLLRRRSQQDEARAACRRALAITPNLLSAADRPLPPARRACPLDQRLELDRAPRRMVRRSRAPVTWGIPPHETPRSGATEQAGGVPQISGGSEYTVSGRTFLFGEVSYLRDPFKAIHYLVAPLAGGGYRIIQTPCRVLTVDGAAGLKCTLAEAVELARRDGC